jgi:hypothetical protein
MSMKCVDCGSQMLESIPCDFGCPHYNCLDCHDMRLARNDIISFCLLVNKSKKPRFFSRIYESGNLYGPRIEAQNHNSFFTKQDAPPCTLKKRETPLGEGPYSDSTCITLQFIVIGN